MITAKQNIIQTTAISIISLFAAFAVLNRHIVTDLGMLSYGRIWHLFISYTDFGFARRSLIGTILWESGISSYFNNEYVFALFIHHIVIFILTALVAFYIYRNANNIDLPLKVGIMLSPAFIIHLGYITGALDIFVLLAVSINILLVRSIYLSAVFMFAGPLIHELFIFMIPAQILATYINNKQTEIFSIQQCLKITALPTLAAIFAISLVFICGKVDVPREVFDATMEAKMPNAAHKHPLWSGFYEVSSTTTQNLLPFGEIVNSIKSNAVYIAVPFFYVVALCVILLKNIDDRWISVGAGCSVFTPLLTYVAAVDLHRWIAMSANMAILLILLIASHKRIIVSGWNYLSVIPFSFLAPLGGADISRPFPLHQFVIEKFYN